MSTEVAETYQEYLPYVGAVKWIRKSVVIENINAELEGVRQMIWHKYEYGDSQAGPWEEFRWVPFGLNTA